MNASVNRTRFGLLPSGRHADLFVLRNANGLVAKVTNYGTILTELHVPDRHGRLGDVVLGFDHFAQYLRGHPYFGCTCGRVANRIAGAQFTLGGRTFRLAANNGPNSLHGGRVGLDKVLWKATPRAGAAVRFDYTSPAGDEGFPGSLTVTVGMRLTDANEFVITYAATTSRATPVNLTNHTYFNLAGRGDIKRHRLMLAADFYTPKNAVDIPTGEIRAVAGTPLDFTRPIAIGRRFGELGGQPQGYDHNFVLRGDPEKPGRPALAARVTESRSGRVLEVFTTEPGVQLYTANWLDGTLLGKGGFVYRQHTGFCLETQHFPDSIHHPHFPSTILLPGETYRQTTIYRFSTL